MGLPACFQESPVQVLAAGSSADCGAVQKRHSSLPVLASYADTQQLEPISLVAGPRITMSFTTSGGTLYW